jgi:hypothetical protein
VFRVYGVGSRVLRVYDFGFRELRVYDFGFRVWDFGFRVEGHHGVVACGEVLLLAPHMVIGLIWR